MLLKALAEIYTMHSFAKLNFFSFFLKDITAPRQRGLSRKVVSGKGLKQRSEFFAMDKKVPALFMQKCRVNLCAAKVQ